MSLMHCNIIKYCAIVGGNFGDDFNLLLWEQLFPDLASLMGLVHLYGIGTLLGGRHDRFISKVVLGTGTDRGQAPTAMPGLWDFRWVRGPDTARALGLPSECALGDAAILWPGLTPGNNRQGPVGLIPHYATWESFDWTRVARQANLRIINPRQKPEAVLAELRACSRVLAESLHGAICADAMAVPWAPCVLAHRFNAFKWRDWMATINRPFTPMMLDRPLVSDITRVKSYANRLARAVNYKRDTRHPSMRPVAAATELDVAVVANALRQYASQTGHFSCSESAAIARQKRDMLLRCEQFAREYRLSFRPT